MKQGCKVLTRLGVSMAALMLAQTAVQAQTAAAKVNAKGSTEATAPAVSGGLETVTVTAQRRTQNLQHVPIAITSFSGDALAEAQVFNTRELATQVPNMFASSNVGQASANVYYIRGLGQTQSFPTFEPQVGTYIDGIYLARQNANNFALFGVQQVQVLNGPQGTLFGRNSTGGAILVTLKKPGNTFGGDASLQYGSYNGVLARGSVNIPLSDQVLTRTSAYFQSQDGYVHDLSTHQRLNGIHNYGFREAVTILPRSIPNMSWNLSVDYERNDAANLLNQPGPNGERISYSGFSKQGGALLPYLTGEKAGWGQGVIVTTYGADSHIKFHFGDSSLELITGYRGLHQNLAADFAAAVLGPLPTADNVPTGEITLAQRLRSYQFSQEVKWNSEIGSWLKYTAGVFYLHESNNNDYGQVLGLSPTFALPLNDQYFNNKSTSLAAYAQGDFKLTNATTLTLGARITNEAKSVVAHPNAPGLGYTTAQIQGAGYPTHLNVTMFTPRVALQYQVNDGLMVFASATRGFQGGGWNGLTGANPIDFNNFGPATVWSYESGFRYQSPDNLFRLNTTAFYENVNNYQLLSDNPYTHSFDTSNAASMFAYGLEANASWMPINRLTLSANLGLIKAAYFRPSKLIQNQIAGCLAGTPGTCDSGIVTADGRLATPVYTPPVQLTLNGNYNWHIYNFTLTPTASVQFVAREWFDTANTPGVSAAWPNTGGQTKARTLVNLGLTYTPDNAPLSITAECHNCTMDNYGVADLLGLDYFNVPGMWDVRVTYRF